MPGQDSGPVQGLDSFAASGSPTPVPASAPVASNKTRRNSNAVAVVGLALAVPVWPLGASLSFVGLVRSGKLGDAGRTLGIIGLVLSLLVGTGSITLLALSLHKSVDHGCVNAEVDVTAFRNSVQTYKSEIQTAETSDDATLANEVIDALVNDLMSDENLFEMAASAAAALSLRHADSTMATDLATVIADYRAIEDTSQGSPQIGTASSTVMNDATKIDGLCN